MGQVEAVHKHLLQQLMGELHLVEDLSLLRTIFFVGSGMFQNLELDSPAELVQNSITVAVL